MVPRNLHCIGSTAASALSYLSTKELPDAAANMGYYLLTIFLVALDSS